MHKLQQIFKRNDIQEELVKLKKNNRLKFKKKSVIMYEVINNALNTKKQQIEDLTKLLTEEHKKFLAEKKENQRVTENLYNILHGITIRKALIGRTLFE